MHEKNFCSRQYGQRNIGFFPSKKKKFQKETEWGRSHVILRYFMQVWLIKYLAEKLIRHSKPAACFFTRSGVGGKTVLQRWWIHKFYIAFFSKFRTKKWLKAQKSPILLNEILSLVLRFEETRNSEDHPRSGRPVLRADCVYVVQSVMEDLATRTPGSSTAREAETRTGIRRTLYGILNLYPYKIQTLHQLLPADTGARQNFATWALA